MMRKRMRKDWLIRQTRDLRGEFLGPMLDEVDKPRRRFLPQTVRGILFSGSPVMMDVCRWVRDDGADRFSQDKRRMSP